MFATLCFDPFEQFVPKCFMFDQVVGKLLDLD